MACATLLRPLAQRFVAAPARRAPGTTSCTISVRGGRSVSTSALVRRSRNGDSSRRSRRVACSLSAGRPARSIGPAKRARELLGAAQQAGVAEAHDRPQLAQAVLHRRAGQRQPEVALQRQRRLGAARGGVLDGLRFVEHHGVPVRRGQDVGVDLQQRVRAHQHLARAEARTWRRRAARRALSAGASLSASLPLAASAARRRCRRRSARRRTARPAAPARSAPLPAASCRTPRSAPPPAPARPARAAAACARVCTVLPRPMSSASTAPKPLSRRRISQR